MLKPRCLLGKQTFGFTNSEGGYILPCCWCDTISPEKDEELMKLFRPHLHLSKNESIDDPTKNGLIIYDKKRPDDWSYDQYNSDADGITKYLKESNAKKRLIPYNYNRIIIFDSRYFHKTNGVSMKKGKENRRVNYTFMFK